MLGFTERIRVHDSAPRGPALTSKLQGREQRRQKSFRPHHLIHQALYNTVQVSLVHAVLCRSVYYNRVEMQFVTVPCVWYIQDPKGGFPTKYHYDYDDMGQTKT